MFLMFSIPLSWHFIWFLVNIGGDPIIILSTKNLAIVYLVGHHSEKQQPQNCCCCCHCSWMPWLSIFRQSTILVTLRLALRFLFAFVHFFWFPLLVLFCFLSSFCFICVFMFFFCITACQNGWTYDQKWYQDTIPSQENWVCAHDLFVTNVFVVGRVTEVAGSFLLGQMGDM